MSDKVEIPRRELEDIRSELARILALLDEITRERPHLAALERRVGAILRAYDADKTPLRPPSQAAMEAFRASVEFAEGKKTPPR